MFIYIIRKIAGVIPTLFIISTIVFLLIHMVPGDPVDLLVGENAKSVDKEKIRSSLGLNQPIGTQYKNFLINTLQLDLGTSFFSKKPVLSEIMNRIFPTLLLTLFAMLFSVIIAFPIGILTAVYKYSLFDFLLSTISLIGFSMPIFWLGPLLILLFAIYFDLLPVSGFVGIESILLPALTLAIPLSAILARIIRASVIDSMKEVYVDFARSKGLSEFIIVSKHVLRNAMIPVISILGIQFGTLLSGTVVVETIFDWPGIGKLFFDAFNQRNYPLIQGCVLFIATIYVFVNLLTDVLYTWVDPRIKL